MSQTMRALVKKEAAEGIWMEDVPIPEAGTNEVLIKVEKTAICGTDVHISITGTNGRREPSSPASSLVMNL